MTAGKNQRRDRADKPLKPGETPAIGPLDARAAAEEEAMWLALASLTPKVDAPKGLWKAIEARIDAEDAAGGPPVRTIRYEDATWELRREKVWKRVLSTDEDTGRTVYFLRCEPGAIIPPHVHERTETAVLIEGEAWAGSTRLRPGDMQISPAGTVHEEVRSPSGCLLLIAA